MEKTLQTRILELENTIKLLISKLEDISNNVEEKQLVPYSKSGGIKDLSHNNPVDTSTGLSTTFSGAVIWNDVDLRVPPYGKYPTSDPVKGYNRHSHSSMSGGALDINTLEIVEYERDSVTDKIIDIEGNKIYHQDCQDTWKKIPKIKKEQNTKEEDVNKIGKLDLIFNADSLKWGVASYEIDVEKCYFVRRYKAGDTIPEGKQIGDIMLDNHTPPQEMKAPLFNETEPTKSNILWDENGNCWRFFAVYAEEPETP